MKMSSEYHLEINSNEMCRCCLARNKQLNSIFRCEIVDGEILAISKVYNNATDLPVSVI